MTCAWLKAIKLELGHESCVLCEPSQATESDVYPESFEHEHMCGREHACRPNELHAHHARDLNRLCPL